MINWRGYWPYITDDVCRALIQGRPTAMCVCCVSDSEQVKRLHAIDQNYSVQSGNLHRRKPVKWWISVIMCAFANQEKKTIYYIRSNYACVYICVMQHIHAFGNSQQFLSFVLVGCHFLRATARSAMRVLAIVILSVCLSVTTRYRFKPR